MQNGDNALEKFQTTRKVVDEVLEILHQIATSKDLEANSRMAADVF